MSFIFVFLYLLGSESCKEDISVLYNVSESREFNNVIIQSKVNDAPLSVRVLQEVRSAGNADLIYETLSNTYPELSKINKDTAAKKLTDNFLKKDDYEPVLTIMDLLIGNPTVSSTETTALFLLKKYHKSTTFRMLSQYLSKRPKSSKIKDIVYYLVLFRELRFFLNSDDMLDVMFNRMVRITKLFLKNASVSLEEVEQYLNTRNSTNINFKSLLEVKLDKDNNQFLSRSSYLMQLFYLLKALKLEDEDDVSLRSLFTFHYGMSKDEKVLQKMLEDKELIGARLQFLRLGRLLTYNDVGALFDLNMKEAGVDFFLDSKKVKTAEQESKLKLSELLSLLKIYTAFDPINSFLEEVVGKSLGEQQGDLYRIGNPLDMFPEITHKSRLLIDLDNTLKNPLSRAFIQDLTLTDRLWFFLTKLSPIGAPVNKLVKPLMAGLLNKEQNKDSGMILGTYQEIINLLMLIEKNLLVEGDSSILNNIFFPELFTQAELYPEMVSDFLVELAYIYPDRYKHMLEDDLSPFQMIRLSKKFYLKSGKSVFDTFWENAEDKINSETGEYLNLVVADLKELKKLYDLSDKDLADFMEIPPGFLQAVENGKFSDYNDFNVYKMVNFYRQNTKFLKNPRSSGVKLLRLSLLQHLYALTDEQLSEYSGVSINDIRAMNEFGINSKTFKKTVNEINEFFQSKDADFFVMHALGLIGKKLKALRNLSVINLEDLSKLVGVSTETISMIENGSAKSDHLHSILQLINFYDVKDGLYKNLLPLAEYFSKEDLTLINDKFIDFFATTYTLDVRTWFFLDIIGVKITERMQDILNFVDEKSDFKALGDLVDLLGDVSRDLSDAGINFNLLNPRLFPELFEIKSGDVEDFMPLLISHFKAWVKINDPFMELLGKGLLPEDVRYSIILAEPKKILMNKSRNSDILSVLPSVFKYLENGEDRFYDRFNIFYENIDSKMSLGTRLRYLRLQNGLSLEFLSKKVFGEDAANYLKMENDQWNFNEGTDLDQLLTYYNIENSLELFPEHKPKPNIEIDASKKVEMPVVKDVAIDDSLIPMVNFINELKEVFKGDSYLTELLNQAKKGIIDKNLSKKRYPELFHITSRMSEEFIFNLVLIHINNEKWRKDPSIPINYKSYVDGDLEGSDIYQLADSLKVMGKLTFDINVRDVSTLFRLARRSHLRSNDNFDLLLPEEVDAIESGSGTTWQIVTGFVEIYQNDLKSFNDLFSKYHNYDILTDVQKVMKLRQLDFDKRVNALADISGFQKLPEVKKITDDYLVKNWDEIFKLFVQFEQLNLRFVNELVFPEIFERLSDQKLLIRALSIYVHESLKLKDKKSEDDVINYFKGETFLGDENTIYLQKFLASPKQWSILDMAKNTFTRLSEYYIPVDLAVEGELEELLTSLVDEKIMLNSCRREILDLIEKNKTFYPVILKKLKLLLSNDDSLHYLIEDIPRMNFTSSSRRSFKSYELRVTRASKGGVLRLIYGIDQNDNKMLFAMVLKKRGSFGRREYYSILDKTLNL